MNCYNEVGTFIPSRDNEISSLALLRPGYMVRASLDRIYNPEEGRLVDYFTSTDWVGGYVNDGISSFQNATGMKKKEEKDHLFFLNSISVYLVSPRPVGCRKVFSQDLLCPLLRFRSSSKRFAVPVSLPLLISFCS